MNYAADALGLTELLKRLPERPQAEQLASLRTFADAACDLSVSQRANYVLARLLMKQTDRKELEQAAACFRKASSLAPLKDKCQEHLTEVATLMGDSAMYRQAKEAIANSKTASDMERSEAYYAIGQSFITDGDQDNARKAFASVLSISTDSKYALGASYYLAEMDLKRYATVSDTEVKPDAKAEAIEQLRRYIRLAPDGRFAEQIVATLAALPGYVPSKEDYSLFAAVKFEAGLYADALAYFQKADDHRKWYKQAICLMRTGHAGQGRELLLSGLKNYPDDPWVVSAASLLAKASNKQQAVQVWQTVLNAGSRYDDEALYNLAIRAPSHGAALPYYKDLITRFPKSKHAVDGFWWVAWSDIEKGLGSKALVTLESGANRYATTKYGPKFAYWIGKVREREGKKDLAKVAYLRARSMQPWNYYAYRAQARLAVLAGGKDEGWTTNPARQITFGQDKVALWDWPEPPAKLAAQAGQTMVVLNQLRQWDECLELAKDADLRAFYLAKLNQPLAAINAATTGLKGKPEKTEIWELAYPLLHSSLIAQAGSKNHIDPLLVQALIREESRYNAQAVSSSNALGLMQLLPGTAYGVAKRLGIALSDRSDIHDIGNNIAMGTNYLGYVHQRHHGNSLFAVASYNGGPNAVARWSQHMPADIDVFVENIPYRETRDYVRKVFGSYWNYRAIYAGKSPSTPTKPPAGVESKRSVMIPADAIGGDYDSRAGSS